MNRHCLLALLAIGTAIAAHEPSGAPPVIRAAPLNAARPYFIPTHPRVTTTVRFPHEIGAPDGSVAVFAEDAEKASGAEYLVSWQQGESYFTIVPLKNARLANLNVPYHGSTYVLYFYAVDDPLNAAASVTLEESSDLARSLAAATADTTAPNDAGSSIQVTRQFQPPERDTVPATPARLIGFLDRLKLIHATARGPRLSALAEAMKVEVAVSREDEGATERRGDAAVSRDTFVGLNDYGWYQIILLRAVRDTRLNCVGFICLIRNTSNHVLTFDVNSFGARAGAEYLTQRISDAPPILKPGDQAPAYFVIEPNRNHPLRAANAWRISVDLLRPRLNPGAAIASGFARQ